MNDEFFSPLHSAGSAGKQIGSSINFNDYNPLVRGYKIFPKTMVCKGCQKVVPFEPFSVITYMNKKLVLEGYCNLCEYNKVIEGKAKLEEWQAKQKGIEREKMEAMSRRMLEQEEQEKKRKNAAEAKKKGQDKGDLQ